MLVGALGTRSGREIKLSASAASMNDAASTTSRRSSDVIARRDPAVRGPRIDATAKLAWILPFAQTKSF
jgi:hypothetical protein